MSSIRVIAGIVPAVLIALLSRAEAASPRNEKVYQAAEANRSGALELLKEIVNIDSGTGDVEGGAKVEAVLRARLLQLGAEVRTEPAEAPGLPDNLVAVFHGTGKGKILVIAHVDTVFGPGTAAARPFSMDAQRAHGPGVGDEKAGVANAFTALKIPSVVSRVRIVRRSLRLNPACWRASSMTRRDPDPSSRVTNSSDFKSSNATS